MKKLWCLLPMLFLLCACHPYKEVENMDIMTSLYINRRAETVVLGGGVANVRSFSDNMADNPVSLIHAEGADLESAVAALRRSADHELFLGALRAVVIGEDYAAGGMAAFIRYLNAYPRLRQSTAVFVTDNDLASVVQYQAINDFSAGFAADSEITTLYEDREMLYTSVGDVIDALSYGDAGYCVPHITIREAIMCIDGYCMFTGGRMIGFTDNPSAAYFNIGQATARHVLDGTPVLTRLKQKTIRPQIQGGALHVEADFVFEAVGYNGAPALQNSAQQKLLEERLTAQIDAALAQSRDLGCDYLTIYKSALAQSRKKFDLNNWNEMLKTMTYSVQVSVRR